MAKVVTGRQTVQRSEGIVVLLIGARVNKWWLLPLVIPILSKMQAMLRELMQDPDSGLLGVQPLGMGGSVQYWRSVDDVLSYANDRKKEHQPTSKRYFGKLFRNEAAGIWHEMFVVPPGHFEALYTNMPPLGMGRFAPLVPATGELATSRQRLSPNAFTPRPASRQTAAA